MKLSPGSLAVSLILAASTFASSQTLNGNLKNGTTNKPAAGDDVILIKLAQGMEEEARTKTDAKGNFSFKLADSSDPHLIRAIHQGVTYHRMAPPNVPSVEVTVYDVSKKVDAISVTADVMRFQAPPGNELQGIRLFAVNNASDPPRTQMNDQNFEFYLPEGAQIDNALAQTAGGQPITSAPIPQSEKNRYAFIFPLRPGETQFQVVFHLPYSGEASINPGSLYAAQHFVVMLPTSMQFTAAPESGFKAIPDPSQSDAIAQVVTDAKAGQSLAFKIAGTGALANGDQGRDANPSPPNSAGRDSRPGGGLGPPIDAPDPLEKYRWYLLGGFAVMLAGGAFYVKSRSHATSVEELPAASIPGTTAAPGRSNLLDVLKEELFQLEVEHKQGDISQEDYEKAKAALDQTLGRAIKRTQQ